MRLTGIFGRFVGIVTQMNNKWEDVIVPLIVVE